MAGFEPPIEQPIADIEPLWGFDGDLSIPMDPLLPEMGPLPCQSSSSPESSLKHVQSGNEEHDPALMRDDM